MRIKVAGVAAVGATMLAVGLAGCGTADHPAEHASTSTDTAASTSSDTAASSSTESPAAATPTGPPIGTATMAVQGSGTATIHYRINGGAEETETDAALPWSKDYPVYPEIQSSVTAEGGTGCTITMQGMLVAFVPDPNPTCEFAYY